jgi:hypothetical protein
MQKLFSQKFKMAPIEALAIVRNFKMQTFLHFIEEQTQKKKKIVAKNRIQNGRYIWRPKLYLIVKTTNHLFSKKKIQRCFSCLNSFLKFSKIQDGAYIQHGDFFGIFFKELSYSSRILKW